jgi:hypothetical protein
MLQLETLEPLVGGWTTQATFVDRDDVFRGTTTFAWFGGGSYLIQHASMEDPIFPTAIMLTGPAVGGERVVQHYFDSRGIARIYEVSLEGGLLRLWRDDADFAQRYSGRFGADGSTIEGAWEIREPGEGWRHDFAFSYTRVAAS